MPKHKFPVAEERLFSRMFICMKCYAKIRADLHKVRAGKIKCRVCKSKTLRPVRKDRK